MIPLLAGLGIAHAGSVLVEADDGCPGPTTVTVSGATPGASIAVISGDRPGAGVVPRGDCAGRVLGVTGHLRVRARLTADATGAASITPDLPELACGSWVVALDLESCAVAPPWELYSPPVVVGSYYVHSGPEWTSDPPTYTCQEACALLLGGAASEYGCSTSPTALDHQAFASTWGSSATCYPPGVPEDYKVNTHYDCGTRDCSVSAYVRDNCSVNPINHCWR